MEKAAPYVGVAAVVVVTVVAVGVCTGETAGLASPACIDAGATAVTTACGAMMGDCGPGAGGDPTSEEADEDAGAGKQVESDGAKAKTPTAGGSSFDDAVGDGTPAPADNWEADPAQNRAAAEPSTPEAGTSAAKPKPRGTTQRGSAGPRSRPAYVHKEAAPANWTPKGQAAKGDSLARAAVVNQRVSRLASRSYVSGYHTETGETAVASSGPGPEGCEGTYCAEGNVVHALGGDWTKVRFGVAYVAEKIQGTDPAMYQPAVKPVCLECKLDYPLSNFVPGVVGEPGGPWSEP